jgi:hypothetical protein
VDEKSQRPREREIKRAEEKKERNSDRQCIIQYGPELHDFTDTYV